MENNENATDHKIMIGIGAIFLIIIIGAIGSSSNSNQGSASASSVTPTTNTVPATTSATSNKPVPTTQVSQNSAPQVSTPAPQASASQTNNSDTQVPPRNSDGTIVQLQITASVGYRNVAFASHGDYTNCSNSLTVITVNGSQPPVFTTYKDNYGSINLFTGDQHSVAYGSLTDSNGDTLAADIISGKYGSNTAGNWGLTCDQGQYGLTINSIQ